MALLFSLQSCHNTRSGGSAGDQKISSSEQALSTTKPIAKRFYVRVVETLFTDNRVKISAPDSLMWVGIAPKAPVRKKRGFCFFLPKKK
ncbi:MAG TPA: hypothetical protein VL125_05515 [Pelobium sp.]|nr:hypothetical protein [Pelobium sp.]